MKQKKIGILGGGQLARMLCLKAHEFNVEVHILSSSPDDPAAQVTPHWHQGDLNSIKDLKAFLKSVDVITFESEFINTELLKKVTSTKPILPAPQLVNQLQNRFSQKELLVQFKIPTSPYKKLKKEENLTDLFNIFPNGFVLKQTRFGYDGYGTFIIKTLSDAKKFQTIFSQSPHQFIAEKFIPFKRELAKIYVINAKGDFVKLPLCESLQKNAKCFSVHGPIEHSQEKNIDKKIKKMLLSLKYVGVFAVEFFESGGKLIVNEVAPRVHNSGHYSLDALNIDQFTYHLRAILNLNLPQPTLHNRGFAMVNLIGSCSQAPQWQSQFQSHLHWYGKKENRPGRKMGHLNFCSSSPKNALNMIYKDLKLFKL